MVVMVIMMKGVLLEEGKAVFGHCCLLVERALW